MFDNICQDSSIYGTVYVPTYFLLLLCFSIMSILRAKLFLNYALPRLYSYKCVSDARKSVKTRVLMESDAGGVNKRKLIQKAVVEEPKPKCRLKVSIAINWGIDRASIGHQWRINIIDINNTNRVY